MKKVFLIILISLFLFGCTEKESENLSYKDIMKQKEYVILDVRTIDEYKESHIKGAINIPYDKIDEKIDIDKEKNVFVYCKSGNRSKLAFDSLKELGFTVYDLGAFSAIDLPKE